MTTFVDSYQAFAIDLDGVMWRGDQILDGARPGIIAIRKAGGRILFLTNNGSYGPSYVAGKLRAGGIEIGEDEVLSSIQVARSWIKSSGLAGARAFVLGPPDVVDGLAAEVQVVDVARGAKVDLVIVARDVGFSFERLAAAADAIREGVPFVAVNRDVTMPGPGRIEPGTGSILAAVEAASGRQALVLGKPETPMMQEAARRLAGAGRALIVGDRLESDIEGGRRLGWDTALVLSGVTTEASGLDPAPTYVLPSLAAIAGSPADYLYREAR